MSPNNALSLAEAASRSPMRARLRAFGIHLGGSALVGVLALALVFLVWYPAPLHRAVGVTGIFFLVLGVDVVIGPVLTLIVFNPAKKSLRFDLSAIVAVQLLAFAYGLGTVAEGRPAWLVFNADRFDLVRAHEVDERHEAETRPEYREAPWLGPRWVSARPPGDPEKRNTLTFEAVFAGVDLPQRPDLYHPLVEEAASIKAKAHPLDRLLRFNRAAAVDAVRARWPRADAWLPLMSNAQPMTVLLNRERGEVVAVVDLRPWD